MWKQAMVYSREHVVQRVMTEERQTKERIILDVFPVDDGVHLEDSEVE